MQGNLTIEHEATLTRDDLLNAGLTAHQVDALETFRSRLHPFIEQFDTGRQWNQIRFLRWLYRTGMQPSG